MFPRQSVEFNTNKLYKTRGQTEITKKKFPCVFSKTDSKKTRLLITYATDRTSVELIALSQSLSPNARKRIFTFNA